MWLINKTTSPITIDRYGITIPGRSQVDIGEFAIDSNYLAGLETSEYASPDKTLKTCISEIDSDPAQLTASMLTTTAPTALRDLVRLSNGDLLALDNYLSNCYRSTDNGNTWNKEQVTVGGSKVEVRALHLRYIDNTLFITVNAGAAYHKKVLKSTDNGLTWELQSVTEGVTTAYTVCDIIKHPDGHWAIACKDTTSSTDNAACVISEDIKGSSCVVYTSAMTYANLHSTLVTVAGVYTALITSKFIEVINNTTGELFRHESYSEANMVYTYTLDNNRFLTSTLRSNQTYLITQYTESDPTSLAATSLVVFNGGSIYPFGGFKLPDGKLLWYGMSSNYQRKLSFAITDKLNITSIGSSYYTAATSAETPQAVESNVDTACGYIDSAGKPVVIFGYTDEGSVLSATAEYTPEKIYGIDIYPNISLQIGTKILLQWRTDYGYIDTQIIEVSDYTDIQETIHSYTSKYAKRIVSARILSADI